MVVALGVSADRAFWAPGWFDPQGTVLVAGGFGVMELEARTVSDLFEAARLRDPYLGPHMKAVSQLSCDVGTRMGISGGPLRLLCTGALLHDVGKIYIPDSMLRKPGPLSHNEYEVMKSHTVLGAEILFGEGLPEAAPVARYHHERFDGRGYPDGLKGEETPLIARIVCVADAMDSMVRDKIYQRSVTVQTALSEILRSSGTQFDPQVVAALVEVLNAPGGRRMFHPSKGSPEDFIRFLSPDF